MRNEAVTFTKETKKSKLASCFTLTIGCSGIIVLFLTLSILFFLEWTNANTYEAITDLMNRLIVVSVNRVDEVNEGKLVYTSGLATTDETLHDPLFDVTAQGIGLYRTVKMYQWVQHIKAEQKNNVTFESYIYRTEWVDHLINSKYFSQVDHKNPVEMPYQANRVMAKNAMLGAFKLPENSVLKIKYNNFVPVNTNFKLNTILGKKAKIIDNGFYIGDNPQNPKVGDVHISFAVVKSTPLTVVAQQHGDSFQPYIARNGQAIEILETGDVAPETLFASMQEKNIRTGVVSFVLVSMLSFIEIFIIFGLTVYYLGLLHLTSLTRRTWSIIALLTTVALALLTTALAWFTFWPWLSLSLLLFGLACLGFAFRIIQIQKKLVEDSLFF